MDRDLLLLLALVIWGPPAIVAAIGAYIGRKDRAAVLSDGVLSVWPVAFALALFSAERIPFVPPVPGPWLERIPCVALTGSLLIVIFRPGFRGTTLCWQALGWLVLMPAWVFASLDRSGSS